jgi:hypothetical protein
VGPRAGQDDVEKRKFLTLPGLELPPLGRQPVVSLYTDCAIPAPYGIIDGMVILKCIFEKRGVKQWMVLS